MICVYIITVPMPKNVFPTKSNTGVCMLEFGVFSIHLLDLLEICWLFWPFRMRQNKKSMQSSYLSRYLDRLWFSFFLTRFNLHMHWTTTIFIISLALADLLYCSIHLPLYAMQFFTHRWILGETLCFAFSAFRYINAFADWMSVGMFTSRFRNTTSKKMYQAI